MKRILSLVLLLLVFALAFTSCEWPGQQPDPEVVYDLDGAVKYFKNVQYPDWKKDGATTPSDQTLVTQVLYKLVAYKVTWVCDNDALAIVDNGNGTLTLDVPKVAEDISYSLTATIADGNGNTQEVKFNLVVPANLAGDAVKPAPGTGYYLQIQQNSLKQVLFFNGKPESESKTYRLAMTTNAGDAAEVFVEEVEGVEGAYRLYFDNNGTKTYLVVQEYQDEDAAAGAGKGTIVWSTEVPTEYYTYNETFKTFVHTDAEGEDSYYMGTYSTYNTISVSNLSYVTDSNIDKSQFPIRFVTPDSVPAHTCKYVSVVTAPTCETKGYTTHTCSLCNLSYTDSEVDMLEHNWTATTPCTNGCGQLLTTNEVKLTVDSLGLESQAYTAGTATVGGVGFEWIQLGNYGDGIQVRDKNGNTSSLWNTTAFSAPIAKIELVWTSTKDQGNSNANCAIYSFGNAAGTYTYEAKLSTEAGVKTYTITPDAQTYTFFKFEHDLGYTQYWESITIILTDGSVVVPPSGGEEGGEVTPPEGGEEGGETPEATEALTSLKTGDKVYIVAPAYNMALSATKTGYYNIGVDVSSGFSALTDAETWVVGVNEDGTYTFTSLTGKNLAMAAANNSLNDAGENTAWSLEVKSEGIFYVKNVVRGTYIEWYASKNNWSTYSPANSDLFEISFYAHELTEGGEEGGEVTPPEGGEEGGEVTPPEGGEEGGETTDVMTIPEVLASAEGTAVVVKGTVSEIYQAWNDEYNNISFYIVDEVGNRLLVYRTGTLVGVGDKVTVTGTTTVYSEKIQIAQGGVTVVDEKHVCSDLTEATCQNLATCPVCKATTGQLADHTIVDGVCSVCGYSSSVTYITASKTMADLITANGWTSSTTKQKFTLDDNVTVQVNGGSNTGKAYNGDHIRIYATDSPAGTLTISVPEGYTLVSVKVSTQTGTYAFLCLDGSSTDISNTTTSISGNSVVLNSVQNGSDGKQVRVTGIEVVYASNQ